MNQIQVDSQIDIIFPENLKVGLIVTNQLKRCASGECAKEFYGLGFGQPPFYIPVFTGDV